MDPTKEPNGCTSRPILHVGKDSARCLQRGVRNSYVQERRESKAGGGFFIVGLFASAVWERKKWRWQPRGGKLGAAPSWAERALLIFSYGPQ